MPRLKWMILILAVSLMLFSGSSLRAELPPGAYDELKKDADEVLHIKITRVTVLTEPEDAVQKYLVEASVTKAERSKGKYQKGAELFFTSYHHTKPITGPSNPPVLKAGWEGRVYLNSDEDGNLGPAAYGRSFEEAKPLGELDDPRNPEPGIPIDGAPATVMLSIRKHENGLEIVRVQVVKADEDSLLPEVGQIITSINGKPVSELRDYLMATSKPNQIIKLNVITSSGQTLQISLETR